MSVSQFEVEVMSESLFWDDIPASLGTFDTAALPQSHGETVYAKHELGEVIFQHYKDYHYRAVFVVVRLPCESDSMVQK